MTIKLDRARELLGEIRAELHGWAALHAAVPLTTVYVPSRGVISWSMRLRERPNEIKLGLRAGEVVYHLRSILDHMVQALIVQATGEQSKQARFPICLHPNDWKATVEQPRRPEIAPLRGLEPGGSAVQFVRRHQPFHHADPRVHYAAGLSGLRNEDAHRVIPAAVLFMNHRPSSALITTSEPLDLLVPANTPVLRFSRPDKTVIVGDEMLVAEAQLMPPYPAEFPTFQLAGTLWAQLAFGSDRGRLVGVGLLRTWADDVWSFLDEGLNLLD